MNFLSYLELKNKKINKELRIIFYLIYLIIGIFGKLGIDYYNYKTILKSNESLGLFYDLLNKISFSIIDVYYFFIILLNIFLLEMLQKKFTIRYTFFYISIFINFFLLDSVSIIRSMQAQLIVLLGIIYIILNKKFKGYLLLLISIFFHKTAILNIFLLKFNFFKKINIKKILLIFFIGLTLSKIFYPFLEYIFKETEYKYYLKKTTKDDFKVNWWVLNGINAFLKYYYFYCLLYLYQKNKKFYKNYNLLIKYSISGFVLITIILSLNFLLSPYIFLRIQFIINTVQLILLAKFQEYTPFNKKEYLKYLFITAGLYIVNHIYILKIVYGRMMMKLI